MIQRNLKQCSFNIHILIYAIKPSKRVLPAFCSFDVWSCEMQCMILATVFLMNSAK